MAVGCIAVGVNDLWNYSSGGVKHSDYFYKRLIQLSKKKSDNASVEEKHERIVIDSLTNAVTFNLTHSRSSVIRVYTNGLLEVAGIDYTVNGNEITFNSDKIAGTEIDIYVYD